MVIDLPYEAESDLSPWKSTIVGSNDSFVKEIPGMMEKMVISSLTGKRADATKNSVALCICFASLCNT